MKKKGIEGGIGTLETGSLNKPTQFFELLAKTNINNKLLNDAYSVVSTIEHHLTLSYLALIMFESM